ncbi:J domain-containing protein [Prochlorococcus sp. MIT 1307]|uniref:J domain-containing protein n=1 Tax=Prochlorococcus sp. MIT 1307 TaxID=3096219 RepID=UPI002A760527|nr:J domain-containing protein [Prochlorococcus sp. MIT 1307]
MAASGYRDYFKVLGVERNANTDSIKRAFRKLARKYHPDVNPGNSEAESKFKEISEAYEVLSDPDKRRRYEQFGQYWNQTNGMAGNRPGGAGFDADFGSYGNFDDFVNDLLGRFGGSRGGGSGFPGGFPGGVPGGFPVGSGFPRSTSRPPINLDAEATLKVTFSEAFNGTERTLSVNDEKVSVLIPKGIKSGSRLRLKGKGNIQPGTGRRGDLYLNLVVQSHTIWRLDGDLLRGELPVAFDELALGAVVKVMTPDGEAQVNIPAGTSPGRSLRLKRKGWPINGDRGDLILTLILDFPDQWSVEELKFIKELQQVRCNDPRKSWLKSACI